MPFSVQKHITEINPSPFKGLINGLILLIAIPVIIIALMSLSLYFSFLWLKNKLTPPTPVLSAEDNYYLEVDLVKNEQVHIILVEDEFDAELTRLNEAWQEYVYNDETCLYRARTVPLIPGIEGCIISFYYKEVQNGLLLQVVPVNRLVDNIIHTQLVYIDYHDLDITLVDEPGAFFLHNDTKDNQLIHGISKKQKLLMKVLETENTGS